METLDKFDIAILQNLQTDARLTNAELASRVGLSAAPCWRRVKALEESGFITGYRAEINRHKIGLGVLAFVRLDAERITGDATQRYRHFRVAGGGTGSGSLQQVCPAKADQPAQCERHAHQLFARRGQGQQRPAAGTPVKAADGVKKLLKVSGGTF
jgi:DNA-binding Lrp family transcriptional regulator